MTPHLYAGTFEAHITIQAHSSLDVDRFRSHCQSLGVKCILIELPAGTTRSQPMTASYHQGTFPHVWAEVHHLASNLTQVNFVVVRVKLEAMVYNQGIPIMDEEVADHSPENYFEFHVKALLPDDTDLDALQVLCCEHGAHLSANAFKPSTQEMHQRFITLRLYGLGRISAQARFATLISSLRSHSIHLVQPQQEYTIYDSHVQLDAGWIASALDRPLGGDHDVPGS